MNVTAYFYNKKGIGDVLIIDLLKNATDIQVKRDGSDLAVIMDAENGALVGFNLFQASHYFSALEEIQGKWFPAQEDVDKLNDLISAEGLTAVLTLDARPDFLIGYVEAMEAHPDADKLQVCQVNIGNETLQIVCGAPNVATGQKVVVARVGALMPSGLLIKDAELRGLPSSGMICSARELGLPNAPQKKGIHILPDDAPIGSSFWTFHKEASVH